MRQHSRFALLTAALAVVVTALPAAYYLNGPRWGTRTVDYYINPANADVSEAAATAAIQAGADTWGSQSNADFRFYYVGRTSSSNLDYNGKNEVFFRNTSAGSTIAETYWWADGGGHLLDADIVFYDGGMQFFTGSSGCANGIYIEDTAAHEFGHALGLGHSADPEATMYYVTSWCSTSGRSLNNDDLSGVEALYPASGGASNTAPSLAISSPSNNSSLTGGLLTTFSATASDQQDGNLSGSIVWSSSLTGQLGVGGTLLGVLSLGTQTITASVTDSGGYTTTKQVTVSVVSALLPPPPASPSVISLTATGTRAKNGARTDLRWSGSNAASVDIYRNGARITTTTNDGQYTDNVGRKASGTYTYRACDASACSTDVTVTY